MDVKKAPKLFNAQKQAQIEDEEYQSGFQAAMRGQLNNTPETLAWHRGWADARKLQVKATLTPDS